MRLTKRTPPKTKGSDNKIRGVICHLWLWLSHIWTHQCIPSTKGRTMRSWHIRHIWTSLFVDLFGGVWVWFTISKKWVIVWYVVWFYRWPPMFEPHLYKITTIINDLIMCDGNCKENLADMNLALAFITRHSDMKYRLQIGYPKLDGWPCFPHDTLNAILGIMNTGTFISHSWLYTPCNFPCSLLLTIDVG